MFFFICGLIFFIAMIAELIFTVYVYIQILLAVKDNREVPNWVYKLGHALKGRGTDYYKDFTDKSVLNDINAYIVGMIISNIICYFVFYGKYSMNNKILFWLNVNFFSLAVVGLVITLGKWLLGAIIPKFKSKNLDGDLSAASNAVKGMLLMSVFTCVSVMLVTGLPEKVPVVQIDNCTIFVGDTSANELISKGFTFVGKNADDVIVNKRKSLFSYGEKCEIIKNGKSYGSVNLTPKYQNKAKLEDCIITYISIKTEADILENVKICGQNISKLTYNDFERDGLQKVFNISPITYRENYGNGHFFIKMQTAPYMLWKSYSMKFDFRDNSKLNLIEVYAQHTVWE